MRWRRDVDPPSDESLEILHELVLRESQYLESGIHAYEHYVRLDGYLTRSQYEALCRILERR